MFIATASKKPAMVGCQEKPNYHEVTGFTEWLINKLLKWKGVKIEKLL